MGNELLPIFLSILHVVFFWQSLTEKPIADIRYVRVAMAGQVGIGGILSYYSNIARLFQEKCMAAILIESGTRYPDHMLRKYFQFQEEGPDADDTNTIEIRDLSSVMATYGYFRNTREIDTSILSAKYLMTSTGEMLFDETSLPSSTAESSSSFTICYLRLLCRPYRYNSGRPYPFPIPLRSCIPAGRRGLRVKAL